MADKKLLDVQDLKTYFHTDDGILKAVDGVSFSIAPGKTLGVVGESGCGKSITSLSILQVVPRPKGRIAGGKILYHPTDGKEVDIAQLEHNSAKMRSLRGNEIGMIFQEPMTSLNPVYTVGKQIMEGVLLHNNISKKAAKARAVEMLNLVGIPSPEQRVDEYPHQFSGGMRQRAMIALALSCNPRLLIADEPTTALDVTVEAQILQLMRRLQDELGMAMMFITHDLGVIGEMADDVMVMYTGKVVEHASADAIFYSPKHPYTQGLLESRPKIGQKKRLQPIRGSVPNLFRLPQGCYFAPRCPHAMDICRTQQPQLQSVGENHKVSCWLYGEQTQASNS